MHSGRELELRPARGGDAEGLFALQRQAELAAYVHIFSPERHPFPDARMRGRWQRLTRQQVAGTEIIVAVEAREIVGVVVAGDGVLERLFVRPDKWGSGIGVRLHDAALQALRQRAHRQARLDVLAENHRARRFYERHGWQPDGRQRTLEYPPHPSVLGYSIDLA